MAHGDMKLAHLLQQASELAVPVIVLGEYQFGIRLSPASTIRRSAPSTNVLILSPA